MDTLTLAECRFDAVIGVFPDERKTTQPLIINIELGIDIRKAAKTDDLKNALDYRAVHEAVKEHVEHTGYFLVETLAERLAARILKKFRAVKRVTLTVKKLKPMQKRRGAWAGVTIVRSR